MSWKLSAIYIYIYIYIYDTWDQCHYYNCYPYRYQDDLLVAQQNIESLQERLLELESQQDRQQGNLTIIFM